MQQLKWFIVVVFATVVAEGRHIRPGRRFEVPNRIDFRRRGTSLDTHIPPPPPNEASFAKRNDLVENGDLVEDVGKKNRRVAAVSDPLEIDNFAKFKEEIKRGCRPRPGSPWCTGKREIEVANPIKIDNFAKFKDEIKRGCRPRPGSPWCTGKREILEDEETVNTEKLQETFPEKLSLQN